MRARPSPGLGSRPRAGGYKQDARWLTGPLLVTAPWYCTISPSQVFLLDPDNEMRKNLIISSGVERGGRKELPGFLEV